jgi:hypothetical protein
VSPFIHFVHRSIARLESFYRGSHVMRVRSHDAAHPRRVRNSVAVPPGQNLDDTASKSIERRQSFSRRRSAGVELDDVVTRLAAAAAAAAAAAGGARCYCMKKSGCDESGGVSFSNRFASSCMLCFIFRISADSL